MFPSGCLTAVAVKLRDFLLVVLYCTTVQVQELTCIQPCVERRTIMADQQQTMRQDGSKTAQRSTFDHPSSVTEEAAGVRTEVVVEI